MRSLSLDKLRGKFIVFDGVDGSGKGVQIRMLTEALAAQGIPFISARDPGGTPIGDRIRHVLLGYDLSEMDARCEALLFMASRAQLAKQVIDPALAAKTTCVCDRYISATCAYQGAAGFDPHKVIQLAKFAIDDTWPHLTLIIDVPSQVGFERTGRRASATRKKNNTGTHGQPTLFHDVETDAMEARPLEFHERVRQMFLELPKFYPRPVAIIDGTGSPEQVHTRIMEAVAHAVL